MAAIIELDNSKFCDPTAFINTLLPVIDKAISSAINDYSKTIIKRWRTKSDTGDVGGSFSSEWKDFKSAHGLKREHYQMHGIGDSRSMYESLVAREFSKGRGWFVGIPAGPVAYDFKGKARNVELWMVAEGLETGKSPRASGPKPIWGELLNESPKILVPLLYNSLVKKLRALGAGDAV